jgi:hypothetical protein
MRQILWGMVMTVILQGAEPYAVVANDAFPVASLSLQQVKQIYLKRMRFMAGVRLVPVNYEASEPLRGAFETAALEMTQKQLNRYWMKEHYLGRRPPVVQSSVQSAVALVRSVDGSLVYVPEKMLPLEGLKVLYRSGGEP